MSSTVADSIVHVLRSRGVKHVFGLIGTAVLDLLDALHDSGITYIGARHEQNAVHMADAYARIKREPAVAILGQPGPGFTNAITGIAQARLAFSPLVVIAGDTDVKYRGMGTFQEIDQLGIVSPLAKHASLVTESSQVVKEVARAFEISASGRKGPVVVNIPGDIFGEVGGPVPEETYAEIPSTPARRDIERVAGEIRNAQRPVVVAGAGVKWAAASQAVVDLAERIGAPIVASAGNGDVVPNDHPLFRGQVGPRGNPVATRLALDADLILALGTRLGFNTTFFSNSNISATARIVHVDIDPTAVGRYFPPAVGIAADVGEFVKALLSVIDGPHSIEAWVRDSGSAYDDLLASRVTRAASARSPFHPADVVVLAQEALPRNTIVTIDTGTVSLAATDTIRTFQPPALLTPLDFGLVGWSFPAGLGAKAAAPERPVLSIVGDGGFGMAIGEIGTAIQAGLPTVTLVLNNGSWGAEKAYQRDFYRERYVGADVANPRFDEVARSFGIAGHRATRREEIQELIKDAIAQSTPTVIEVEIDPSSIQAFRKALFEEKRAGTAEAG